MRKLIRKLIKESLFESRKVKQQFHSQIRSQYPDIEEAYFVHWIWEDITQWEHLESRLNQIMAGTRIEYSANLVDPSGNSVQPHYGDWGPVGIVFQGIPTFGSTIDLESGWEDTPSGTRRYPSLLSVNRYRTARDGNQYFEIEDPQEEDTDFDVFSNIEMNTPTQKAMDLSVPRPFMRSHPGFPYPYAEFFVIPKVVKGVIYLPEYDRHTDIAQKSIADSSRRFNIPHVQGKENISKFFKFLYENN